MLDFCELSGLAMFSFVSPYILVFLSISFGIVIQLLLKTLQMLHHLENRRKEHMNTIKFCQNILQQKPVDWEPILRNNLSQPICNVDLVITVGGDGTLLQASHFMDDSVPVVGVNSDPTQIEEVSLILLKLPSYQECVSMGFFLSFSNKQITVSGAEIYPYEEILFDLFSSVQVEQFSNEFDANRSTGHLCAATVNNFQQVRQAHCFDKI